MHWMHPAAITAAAVRVVNNAYLMGTNADDRKCLIAFSMTEDVELVGDARREGCRGWGWVEAARLAGADPEGNNRKGEMKRKKEEEEEGQTVAIKSSLHQ